MGGSALGRPIVPKEHGAWAVLYGAFAAGIGVAGRVTVPAVLLLVAVTCLAFANGPLALLLRPGSGRMPAPERRRTLGWLGLYLLGAAIVLLPLLLVHRMGFLLVFGGAAAAFLLLRALLLREGDDRSLTGELIGTTGLAMVGPTAHAVAAGGVEGEAFLLWLLLTLFFASGIFYVRMRIRALLALRKGETASSSRARHLCLGYHALLLALVPLLAATGLVPWAVLLAFAPPIWRAAAGLRRREPMLNLKRLGWSEVALTGIFVTILAIGL